MTVMRKTISQNKEKQSRVKVPFQFLEKGGFKYGSQIFHQPDLDPDQLSAEDIPHGDKNKRDDKKGGKLPHTVDETPQSFTELIKGFFHLNLSGNRLGRSHPQPVKKGRLGF